MIFTSCFPSGSSLVWGPAALLAPTQAGANSTPAQHLRPVRDRSHAHLSSARFALLLYTSRAGLLLYASRAALLLWSSRAKAPGGNPVCLLCSARIFTTDLLCRIFTTELLCRTFTTELAIWAMVVGPRGPREPGSGAGRGRAGRERRAEAGRGGQPVPGSCNRSRRPTVARCLQDLEEPAELFDMVERVKAIRRFTVRTVLPASVGRTRRAGDEPALVLEPRHPRPVRVDRPGHLAQGRRRPVAAARDSVRPRGWPSSPTDEHFLGRLDEAAADLRDYLEQGRWYQSLGAGGAAGDRLLLAGVRHHRGAAAVLRRARHPRRRPPQGGQRPRRADHRRRPALSARLLQPVAVAATAGSRSATRRSTRTACR